MSESRELRIAAIGDIHFDSSHPGALRDLFADIHRSADVLALCGDLTTHGKVDQMRAFVGELAGVQIPMVAVLGNHDHESDEAEACTSVLCDAGVEVLDGTNTIIEGVGFAGTKGFAGGFGRGALGPFGETLIKEFVNAAVDEALKLERALQQLRTETRVVLLHYAPMFRTQWSASPRSSIRSSAVPACSCPSTRSARRPSSTATRTTAHWRPVRPRASPSSTWPCPLCTTPA
jgi:Icc-related predicted phosphoesterase